MTGRPVGVFSMDAGGVKVGKRQDMFSTARFLYSNVESGGGFR